MMSEFILSVHTRPATNEVNVYDTYDVGIALHVKIYSSCGKFVS